MDTLLFTIGDFAVTASVAALGGLTLAAAVVVATIVVYFRRDRARVEGAADAAASALKANFREHIEMRDRQIGELKAQIAEHIAANAELLEANADLRVRSAALEAQMSEQARQEEENLARFLSARQQMTDEFKALAGEVLRTHGETFSRQNREQVDLLLKPLSEKIGEFQSGMVRDRAELGQRIQHLLTTGMTMSQEASALTRALKGNAQVQGAWGEMVLSSILKNSGLREGEQFFTQQSHTAEDGQRLRTDVEVLLPNGGMVVIDSKVSLLAFETYVNANDETERSQALRAHVASLRKHIATLAGKQYQRHARSGLDFVILFVPIEAAFAAAVTADLELIPGALRDGVTLATPTTLLTTLRTVANVWDIEKRQQNAEQIAERAGALYDKVVGFLDTMDRVQQSFDRTRNVFADARNQLSGGRGSVVRQVELLKELGAKTNKQIPVEWTEPGTSDVVALQGSLRVS